MSSPRRFCKQMEMYHDVTSGKQMRSLSTSSMDGQAPTTRMVTMAIINVTPNSALKRVVSYLGANSLNISRVHVDVVQGETESASNVTMLRVLLSPFEDDEGVVHRVEGMKEQLERDLPRVAKWVDAADLEMYNAAGDLSLLEVEAWNTLASAAHALGSPRRRRVSRGRGSRACCKCADAA